MATAFSTTTFLPPTSATNVYHQFNQAFSAMDSFINLDNYVHNCSAYRHKIPPTAVGHQDMEMTFEPFQIMSVNEVDQTVSVGCVLYLFWLVPFCWWEPKDFNGLNIIDVDSDKIWTPIVGMPKGKSAAVLKIPEAVQLTAEGFVVVLIPDRLDTACDLDLTQYPFDVQNCSIIFIELHGLGLVSVEAHKDLQMLKRNFVIGAEWQLLEKDCSVISEQGNSSYVECWFTLARKSLFHVTTMIIPLISMSVMTLVVFRIPAESGEKMSFVVSIFVSMLVFINLLVGVIPRSMDKMPRGVVCVVAIMIKTGLAAWAATVVLRRYEDEKREYIFTSFNRRLKESIDNTGPTTAESKLTTGKEVPYLEVLDVALPEAVRERSDTDRKQFNAQRLRANKVGDSAPVAGDFDAKNGGPLLNESTAARYARLFYPCNGSRLSHSQLDNLFFAIFALATIMIYLLVFLS